MPDFEELQRKYLNLETENQILQSKLTEEQLQTADLQQKYTKLEENYKHDCQILILDKLNVQVLLQEARESLQKEIATKNAYKQQMKLNRTNCLESLKFYIQSTFYNEGCQQKSVCCKKTLFLLFACILMILIALLPILLISKILPKAAENADRSIILSSTSVVKSSSSSLDLILIAGGSIIDRNVTNSAELYNIRSNRSLIVADMLTARAFSGSTMAVANGNSNKVVVVFGGIDDQKTISAIEAFDPISNQWSSLSTSRRRHFKSIISLSSMPQGRFGMGVINVDQNIDDDDHHQKLIYIIGGYDEGYATSSVLSFNLATGHWQSFADLTVSRAAAGVAAIRSGGAAGDRLVLYACGGVKFLGGNPMDSCEYYNFGGGRHHHRWRSMSTTLNRRRHGATMVALNDSLMICGGNDGYEILRSCELLNPVTQRWELLSSELTQAREYAVAAVADNKVYIFGGANNNGALKSIEMYDPIKSNRWIFVGELNYARFAATGTAL